MPALTVFALAGAALGLWLPLFENAQVWPVLTVALLPLAWWFGGIPVLTIFALLSLSSLHCHWYMEQLLPAALLQKDIVVRGIVADFPRDEADSVSFAFRLVPDQLTEKFPRNVLLRIYAAEPRPRPGELWQFRVRLKRPMGKVNVAGHDSEQWALWNHIHASGYVRESLLNQRLDTRVPGMAVLRMRDAVRRSIDTVLADHPMLPMVQGVAVAAVQSIDPETWQILRDSGTSHLMAISGMNIALVAAFLWYPGRLAGGLLHSAGWLADPLRLARALAFGGAVFYGALAGYPTPTVRACLMITFVLLLGGRHRSWMSGLGVLTSALLLVLLASPLEILSPGFWLSFLAVGLLYACVNLGSDEAVAGIVQRSGCWQVTKQFLRTNCHAQWVLGVGLALPSLLFFAQVSVVAFIANPFAIPLFTFFILPLSLLGAALVTLFSGAGAWMLVGAANGFDWLITAMDLLARLPGAVWRPAALDLPGFLLLLLASVLALLPRPLPGRLAGAALLCIALVRDTVAVEDRIRLDLLDVGQGLAVLVQTAGHSLLYDTGARWPGGDSGRAVIVPVLQAYGIRELDVLIVSHDDTDHSGGLLSTLETVKAKQVIAPTAHYLGLANAAECRAGHVWQWEGVKFSLVHPANRNDWSDNDASCALLIEVGGRKFLLPGDIEARAEQTLIANPSLRNIDLVVAPHHGSRTSSTSPFVQAMSAEYVIFSAGYANRWGFPKADVVRRWRDSGSCTLTTAETGALTFRVSIVGELILQPAARASWTRPWVLRDKRTADCSNTINGE